MTPAEAIAALAPLPDGFTLTNGAWSRIVAGYGQPHRHYHNFDHVLEVRAEFAEVSKSVGWERPIEVFAAVLYHDVIYDIGAADNEMRSAQVARADVTASMADADADRVADLIELTARHGKLSAGQVDREAALFLDCDMAILGAEPERYDAYAAGVRAEYTQAISDAAYNAGRAQFLARCLEMSRIYLSEAFVSRLEDRARENLRRELAICSGENLR